MNKHKKNRYWILWLSFAVFYGVIGSNHVNPTQEENNSTNMAASVEGAEPNPQEIMIKDLSREEFVKLLGDHSLEVGPVGPIKEQALVSYPPSIDWRNNNNHNYVTGIRYQGGCQSCVAFDAVAVLESLTCIEQNRPDEDIDLSEMTVYFCGGRNCSSGWDNGGAVLYLDSQGAPDEACWPYSPIDSSCSNACTNKQLRAVTISDFGAIMGIEACKNSVAIAPIMATIRVYADFQGLKDQIYVQNSQDFLGNHSICIIGYDTTGPIPYWIVKNSWGITWGNNGFGRIKMGEIGIEDACYWLSGALLPSIPASPTNLTANGQSDTAVRINWHDNSENESGFEIQRKNAQGNFSHIASASGNAISYLDNTVSGESLYTYRVRAYNVGGYSGFSNTIDITTPPIAPTSLAATTLTSGSVHLTWTDNSAMEDGFEIWQSKDSGAWGLKVSVGSNVTSTDITGLAELSNYCYEVRAYNSNGESNYSNQACSKTLPNAPTNLLATPGSSVSIYLYWHDNSSGEDGFEIWQQQAGGSWQLSTTVGQNVTLVEISGLSPGTNYCFKVRAYRSSVKSDWSNTACATTQSGVPIAPSNLVTTGYCYEVQLRWKDNSNNETGFRIYLRSGTMYFLLDEVGANVTTYWNTDLPCGQKGWCYFVRSFNQNGNSPASNISCANTSYCGGCGGGMNLEVSANENSIASGGTIVYTYRITNKGVTDLTNVDIKDSELGIIVSNESLKQGEVKLFTRYRTLTKTVTNIVEATATYTTQDNKTERVAAHACVTVAVK
jgi:C1A family cysteine protease